jgi:hypothetical protein
VLRLAEVAAALENDLRNAGPQFSIGISHRQDRLPVHDERAGRERLPELLDAAISIRVEGMAYMWLLFSPARNALEEVEELASLVDQVQDEVMESTHEMWPKCPLHNHELLPSARQDWVVWECPETERTIARFGELPA